MQRMFWKILAIGLLMSSAAYGQSLGDIARENREKKAEDASVEPPKVITNKDLPHDPDVISTAEPAESPADRANAAQNSADERQFAAQRLAEQRAADQWKRAILEQKRRVQVLQARIDQIHAEIRNVSGSVQYEPPYDRYQARQMERVARIQQQLNEQRRRLEHMQDAARRAGMHTAVYDP